MSGLYPATAVKNEAGTGIAGQNLTEREKRELRQAHAEASRAVNAYTSVKRPDMARKLANIMTRQRHGQSQPEYGMRTGRVDRTRLAGVPAGRRRVFMQRGAPSPTKLRMVVLLDMSGSMRGTEMRNGIQMCRDLIEATMNIPSVTTEVWGQTTADLFPDDDIEAEAVTLIQGDYIVLKELWKKGTSFERFHAAVNGTFMWGNEDGFALTVLEQEVLRTKAPDERLFFVVVSDGAPVYAERRFETTHVKGVVDRIRKHGAGIISVAIGEGLRAATQAEMYGKDFVVAYDDDVNKLAQAIAKAVGKALD